MSAYFGTWRVIAAQAVTPDQLAIARKLVGAMLEQDVMAHRQVLADGTEIRVLIVDGMPKVVITSRASAQEQAAEATDLWVPRGFVVYPAWQGAPGGVGLPIVANGAYGPYDPPNLAPGLDVSLWTPGGPCGEVLLSQDTDAGYPTNQAALTVPLLFDPVKGPVFRWAGDGMYDARDVESAWKAYRMELDAPRAHYADEDVGSMNGMLEAVNAYRVANSMVALTLTPRGYYHAGAVMVSIMQAAGSTDATNAAYPANYGTPDDRLTKDGFSATLMGTGIASFNRGDNPTAFELRALGGTAASTLDAWKAVPAANNTLLADVGRAAFTDVGYRGGYWAVDVVSRTRWIEAGNCIWQGSDTGLPVLSWHGFASVNLAWETYPAQYDVSHYTTAPLVPQLAFTDANGDCWLNYPRSAAPAVADVEPGMSRHIYARGRAIALAPRGGLVWGASVVRNGNVDRLIALVHHPEDQPADYTTNGWTRYLRVWWCDIPRRDALRADPQLTICGEDASDPWGWKGGEQLDMGHMPPPSYGTSFPPVDAMSLKYASQWRFSSDGTRAVCMRDYGGYTDYMQLYAVIGISSAVGLPARAVELVFTPAGDSTTTSITWHDYANAIFAAPRPIAGPLDTTDTVPGAMFEYRLSASAVDFAADGSLVYAYVGSIADAVSDLAYYYAGIGPAGTEYASDLTHRVLTGAGRKTASQNFVPSGIQVADVPAAAFSSDGTRPRFNQSDGSSTDPACFPFTAELVQGVRMMRAGTLLDETWYPAPDGVVFSGLGICDNSPPGSNVAVVLLPLASSRTVQAYYAERFGNYVFCTQVSPVPQAVSVLDAPPSDATCGCQVEIHKLAANSHLMALGEWNPRGGRAFASVPLPNHDWLIYAKAV